MLRPCCRVIANLRRQPRHSLTYSSGFPTTNYRLKTTATGDLSLSKVSNSATTEPVTEAQDFIESLYAVKHDQIWRRRGWQTDTWFDRVDSVLSHYYQLRSQSNGPQRPPGYRLKGLIPQHYRDLLSIVALSRNPSPSTISDILQDLTSTSESLRSADWGHLIRALATTGNLKPAQELLDKVCSDGLADSHCWNGLLEGFVKNGDLDQARKLYHRIPAGIVRSNDLTLLLMVDVCERAGNRVLAEDFWRQMKGHLAKCASSSRKRTGTYHRLIKIACRNRHIERAFSVLQWMIDQNVKPTVETYTLILLGCYKVEHLPFAESLLWKMEFMEIQPDLYFYSCYVQFLCDISAWNQLEKVVADLSSRGIKPDVDFYNILIGGFARSGQADSAAKFLDTVMAANLEPTPWTISTMIVHHSRLGSLSVARGLFEHLVSDSNHYSTRTRKSVVGAFKEIARMCAQSGSMEMAEDLYRGLQKTNFTTDPGIISSFINGYVMLQDGTGVAKWYDKMRNLQQWPAGRQLSLWLQDSTFRGSIEANIVWEDGRMTPDSSEAALSLIFFYLRRNDCERAVALFKQIRANGILPSTSLVTRLLATLRRFLQTCSPYERTFIRDALFFTYNDYRGLVSQGLLPVDARVYRAFMAFGHSCQDFAITKTAFDDYQQDGGRIDDSLFAAYARAILELGGLADLQEMKQQYLWATLSENQQDFRDSSARNDASKHSVETFLSSDSKSVDDRSLSARNHILSCEVLLLARSLSESTTLANHLSDLHEVGLENSPAALFEETMCTKLWQSVSDACNQATLSSSFTNDRTPVREENQDMIDSHHSNIPSELIYIPKSPTKASPIHATIPIEQKFAKAFLAHCAAHSHWKLYAQVQEWLESR